MVRHRQGARHARPGARPHHRPPRRRPPARGLAAVDARRARPAAQAALRARHGDDHLRALAIVVGAVWFFAFAGPRCRADRGRRPGPGRRSAVWSSSASIPAPRTPATAWSPARARARRARRRGDRDLAGLDPGERLAAIFERVDGLLDEYAPDALAVEDLYFGANARSAFAVGRARGRASSPPASAAPCRSYTPQQVKGAVCGSGRAAKAQVQRMVQTLLSLTDLPRPDHAADALAAAICHANGAPLRAASSARRDRAARRRGRRPPHGPRRRLVRRRRLPARGLAERCATPRGRQAATLHAHLIVRDDALHLYGFASEAERDLFLLLIGVQGVGPKVALAVLSGGTPRELLAAVAAGDTARLQAVPDRQAHRGADRRRAAREGRRGARRRPARRRPRRRPAAARPRRPVGLGYSAWRPSSCSRAPWATRPRR